MRKPSEAVEFTALFEATSADVLAFLLRRCPTPEDAADCLAETYLVAWEKRRRMPGGAQARPWLFGVARNVMRRGRERQHRAATAARALAIELVSAGAVAAGRIVAEPDPLTNALGELSELDREILTMACWDDLTPREIAAVLGTSANVVRVRAHRARARLRSSLAGDGDRAGQQSMSGSI